MKQVVRSRAAPFGIVGAIGVVVQVALISLLTRVAGLPVWLATTIAVEATILHNFAWHERWTWADRAAGHPAGAPGRLVRFNAVALGTLAISVALTAWLVRAAHLPVEAANLAAVVVCSLLNYSAIERVVVPASRSPIGSRTHGATWRGGARACPDSRERPPVVHPPCTRAPAWRGTGSPSRV